jgi:IPT/TIG domain.
LAINTYSIEEISPVSGPIETGTIIVVKGSGFINSENIRCRFGVPRILRLYSRNIYFL